MTNSSLDRRGRGHSPNMATRRSALLTSFTVLVLTPLLAAPRGCYFGAADVPLGANHDEEVGGAGDGDAGPPTGGTGGGSGDGSGASSSGSSGASTSGSSGAGVDGGSLGGSDAGSSGGSDAGSSGGSGGSSSDLPCIETVTPLSEFDENPAPFDLWQVDEWFGGAHRAPLDPRYFDPTMVTLQFVGPLDLYWVESERNPDLPPDVTDQCGDHMRVRTYARFFSDDGLFDETFPDLELNIEPVGDGSANLFAHNPLSGPGVMLFVDELRGTYKNAPRRDGACLWSLQLDFVISADSFSGGIFESLIPHPLLDASCLENDPDELEGSVFGDWYCQGDCRDTPNVSIVVEAESCDRFGVQLTRSGDEASFSRAGDVLTRHEEWGCGCPLGPEFVMAYTPTSPMELRLCHNDFGDSCEAACQAPVSHDLTRAFDWVRTTEFRFVD